MPARKRAQDQFPQLAYLTVTESAANTITFAQLQTGGMLFERRALIIHRVEYYFGTTQLALLTAEADYINTGLSTNSSISGVSINDPNIIDLVLIQREDDGTAATSHRYQAPHVRDFTSLPGGGLLVPAHPLYLFVQGQSLASAANMDCRIYFTTRELSANDFIELVEAMRIIT